MNLNVLPEFKFLFFWRRILLHYQGHCIYLCPSLTFFDDHELSPDDKYNKSPKLLVLKQFLFHRMVDIEGTSGGYLFQPPCSRRAT